jgi:hypothetical protein
MKYTIKMTFAARQSLYQIPRGVVADVTAAISRLATTPTPFDAVAAGLPNTYLIAVTDHVVAYEVIQHDKVIKVLWIR